MNFLKANYHTHTTRCKHAYDTEREYIEKAIEMGITKLGFSDHVPCPYKNGDVSGIRMSMSEAKEYVETIRKLGEEYKDKIEIYVGFEAEYIPEFFQKQIELFDSLNCDYLIMGQHFLRNEELGPYTGAPTNDEDFIKEYVDAVLEGMRTGRFKYIAHPDLINYQGPDEIYNRQMTRLCEELKKMDIPVELNILGIGVGKHYPAERFWAIAGKTGNKVIMGLDAHCVQQMADVESYNKAMTIARKYNLQLINELDIK